MSATTLIPTRLRSLGRAPDEGAARRYETMLRARATDEVSAKMWRDGLVSGELHTSSGEEAVVVGVVDHLRGGDGLASDHRSTAPFVARGVPPFQLLAELLGSPEGVCGGHGGHMHLAEPSLRIFADGIVGSSAPTACGFALQSQLAGGEGVAVAFFGEGAANQGMLLEALNLAVVWKLPVVFVCKQSGLAITTTRRQSTGGSLVRRARGFGMPAATMSGQDVEAVWRTAGRAVRRARRGRGPTFLLAPVHRPDGHLLGDPLLRIFDDPSGQAAEIAPGLIDALRAPGALPGQRAAGLGSVVGSVRTAGLEALRARSDPLAVSRRRLSAHTADMIDRRVRAELDAAAEQANASMPVAFADRGSDRG